MSKRRAGKAPELGRAAASRMWPPATGRITAWDIYHDTEIDPRSPRRFPTRLSRGGRVKIEWAFTTIEEAQAFLESLPIPEYRG